MDTLTTPVRQHGGSAVWENLGSCPTELPQQTVSGGQEKRSGPAAARGTILSGKSYCTEWGGRTTGQTSYIFKIPFPFVFSSFCRWDPACPDTVSCCGAGRSHEQRGHVVSEPSALSITTWKQSLEAVRATRNGQICTGPELLLSLISEGIIGAQYL